MKKFKKQAAGVYVSEQLTVEDISEAKAGGITTIVCNRPDGEGGHQISSATLAAVAGEQGIAFVYMPMTSPTEAAGLVDKITPILQAQGDVLLYCRSGRRSTALCTEALK